MGLPIILPCFIILCIVVAYSIRHGKSVAEKEEDAFWERERAANSTRRKPLDNLEYITVPIDILPITLHIEDNTIKEYVDTIVELSKSPIVNLTGISNTDLKLQYGAPNIDLLSLYDQRYTTLACILQKWADRLFSMGETEAVRTILEFAVSTRTDVSGSYRLLCTIYGDNNDAASIRALLPIATSLNSPMKDSIVSYIESCL